MIRVQSQAKECHVVMGHLIMKSRSPQYTQNIMQYKGQILQILHTVSYFVNKSTMHTSVLLKMQFICFTAPYA